MSETSGISEQCVQQILTLVSDKALFGPKKAYDVYDPSIFLDIVKPMNYPACGVTYGGIFSENNPDDQGTTSSILVTLIILAESKVRDAKRQADRGTITALLDRTRSAILTNEGQPRVSPTGKNWRFVHEHAAELKDRKTGADRGLAYVQVFKTSYTGAEDGPRYYSGSGEVLVSRILNDGTPEGYRSVGTVTGVNLLQTAETLDHRDAETNSMPTDAQVSLGKKYKLNLRISALSKFGEEFFRGETVAVSSSTGSSATYRVRLGYRYTLPVLNTENQIFKNQSAATLREDKNFIWTNKAAGTFEILADQTTSPTPLVDGQIITATYTNPEQYTVGEPENPNEVFAVRVEGLNNVNGDPVALEGFRAARGFNTTRALQSEGVEKNDQTLILVADPTREHKHYKELKI